jgi:ribosome-binding protein aMBF1 (putative translation factor)
MNNIIMHTPYYKVNVESKILSTNGYTLSDRYMSGWKDVLTNRQRKRLYSRRRARSRHQQWLENIISQFGSKLAYYEHLAQLKRERILERARQAKAAKDAKEHASAEINAIFLDNVKLSTMEQDYVAPTTAGVSYYNKYLDAQYCKMIAEARCKQNLTQKDMAQRLNITLSVYREYENPSGCINPKSDILRRIKEELNMNVSLKITRPQNISTDDDEQYLPTHILSNVSIK